MIVSESTPRRSGFHNDVSYQPFITRFGSAVQKYNAEHNAIDAAREQDMVDSLKTFMRHKMEELDRALEKQKVHGSDHGDVTV